MAAPELRRAKAAAKREELAKAALEDAIREIHSQGVSLRKIAEVVGLSHTQVSRIVSR